MNILQFTEKNNITLMDKFDLGLMSQVYNKILTEDFNSRVNRVLEIGISDGRSILLWRDYFSQAEIDDEIVNFTRFEFKMPEKRQFFVENNDIYTNFGEDLMMNPFFSRRIGIGKDINGNSIENKIDFGMRLSGKLNNNFRIGLLNMQTQEDRSWKGQDQVPHSMNDLSDQTSQWYQI